MIRRRLFAAVCILAPLPVAYFASLGPMIGMYRAGWIHVETWLSLTSGHGILVPAMKYSIHGEGAVHDLYRSWLQMFAAKPATLAPHQSP